MTTTTAKLAGHHAFVVDAHRIEAGTPILVGDDILTVATVIPFRDGAKHKGYIEFSFEDLGTLYNYTASEYERITIFLPIPKVGDLATLCYPSDRYPYIVTDVSASGRTIRISLIDYRIVSGSFMTGDAKVEYHFSGVYPRYRAFWSDKSKCYKMHGTPVSIGHARYYQAPEV